MRVKLAIYNWNGTLIDDVRLSHACVVHIFQTLAPKIKPPTLTAYRNEITSRFHDFYRRHGIPEHVTPEEMNAIRSPHYNDNASGIRLHEGVGELLQFCKSIGIPNAMVSASPENVADYLSKFGLLDFFQLIKLEARQKDKALTETVSRFGIAPDQAFYLDDTADGIAQAKCAGLKTIGFIGGYNSERRIRAAKPDYVVRSLREVIGILQNGN